MTAASRGSAESVQVLLDNGASLLSVNSEGGSVALALATGGLLEHAQKLYATHPQFFTVGDRLGNAAVRTSSYF